ncbi:MAG: S-layer protein domain-containing protein [Candidatus Methanoperedens sp.]|nr:S-layer protein domain-containing protein [Candidatus Methanoperedens sp.]
MAIKRYLQGIAIVALLMMGTVLIVMAAGPSITFVSPTPDNGTISSDFINVSVTLSPSGGAAWLNWNGTFESMTGTGTQFYKNKSGLMNQIYTFYVNASDVNGTNWTTSNTRVVTVNVPSSLNPPGLSNPNPSPTVNSIFGFSQNFNITVNQTANVSWKINSIEVQNISVSAGAKSDYISNASQAIGNNYAVTATAYNVNGTSASTTWTWNVLPSQGPSAVSVVTSMVGATWINWTWTNPTDNFNYTIVKINTTFQTNTSNNYFNYTQFSPGSLNNISLQTVDTSGIINSTIIQNSVHTYNTPAGPNINVNYNNVNVTFLSIVTEGNTSISIVPSAGGSLTFTKAGSFYNISSTAVPVPGGNISIEIPYESTGINESNINLYHWNGVSWDDVTTSVDTVSNKVKGNVTGLSPFVAGVPPVPVISNPNNASVITIVNKAATFNISTDSTTNIVWYLDNNTAQTNNSIVPGAIVTYTVSAAKGSHNVTVIATNTTTFSSSSVSWSLGVHSSTFSTGNRIWDGSKQDDFALTYYWTPMSFSGFYYNAKDNVGNENIKITVGSYDARTISKSNLVYTTSPQEVSFTYSPFGKYQVIGFMAEKYFAGYNANTSSAKTHPTATFDGKSAVGQGQLHKVLIDDDTKRTISVGGTIALKEGYVLKATDIDLNARTMLLSLMKDGSEVDVAPLAADETYVYSKRVGGVEDLPLILVRFENVFSGNELQVAFMKGLFQISENPTIIQNGNMFRNMEITQVSDTLIEMKNSNNIGLSKGATVDIMGDVKILVANNVDSALRFALSVEKMGDYEVRSTVYRSDDASAIREWTPYNFGMNIGKTSLGFFYDLDDGVGSEKLTLLNPVSGRSIPDQGLTYSTTPVSVKFIYTGFGKYQVIGFMADKYFAGYTSETKPAVTRPTTDFAGKSAISNGALHKVLIDDDTKRTISVGGTIALKDGYVIKATDIDLNARTMLISLLKDGSEVDLSPLTAGETYVYTKTVGGTENLPVIMVRFENVFSGQELQVAFLKGIFQISDSPTVVQVANQFGKMEVRSVSGSGITMSNDGSIGLDRNKNEVLMGNLRLKVADTSAATRFYFAVDVTPEMIVNQLVIEAPAKAMAGDMIKIKITAGGAGMDNATVNIGTDSATTGQNGILEYTIPKELKGTYTITVSKTGYEKATQNLDIEKYVDYRLSLDAPSQSNQYETITLKVLYNGTAMSGASVKFDNTTIGTSDSNGEITYRLEASGTHSISASKTGYISVARDIDIRAPYSEFKALDINITPNPGLAGEAYLVRSNITNVGTIGESTQVELIVNGTVVDNKTVTIAPKEKMEVNFTRIEAMAGNVTVEIMGQSILYEAKENPTNYLLIGAIITGIGAVIIYVLTSKGLLSIEILKEKSMLLKDAANEQAHKISKLFKK